MAEESTSEATATSGTSERLEASFAEYPLSRALHERRARRFSTGMSIPEGPLRFESSRAPKPLTEEEQAILAFAACGLTGAALADWSYAPEAGGTMMARTVGRTISSPDAVHTAADQAQTLVGKTAFRLFSDYGVTIQSLAPPDLPDAADALGGPASALQALADELTSFDLADATNLPGKVADLAAKTTALAWSV